MKCSGETLTVWLDEQNKFNQCGDSFAPHHSRMPCSQLVLCRVMPEISLKDAFDTRTNTLGDPTTRVLDVGHLRRVSVKPHST